MNTAQGVTNDINNWKTMGMTKAELAVKIAEDCLGWSYVWGGYGQICNSSNRGSYANRDSCPDAEKAEIRRLCQILNGSKSSCSGCKWYPGGSTRFFDCRGFTRWVLQQVGITIEGAGATSQYRTASNWTEQGNIKDMPMDKVCCVFMYNAQKNNYSHTGLHIGGGNIIHCSGTVKRGKITDKGWTNYAIPKGMEGDVPVPTPGDDRPTLRKGSSGEYVTLLQTMLIQRGYDLSPYGADGKYGNKTVEAVKAFQRDNGLTADGITGKNTWAALDSGTVPLYTVTIQHISKTVAENIIGTYGGTMTAEG